VVGAASAQLVEGIAGCGGEAACWQCWKRASQNARRTRHVNKGSANGVIPRSGHAPRWEECPDPTTHSRGWDMHSYDPASASPYSLASTHSLSPALCQNCVAVPASLRKNCAAFRMFDEVKACPCRDADEHEQPVGGGRAAGQPRPRTRRPPAHHPAGRLNAGAPAGCNPVSLLSGSGVGPRPKLGCRSSWRHAARDSMPKFQNPAPHPHPGCSRPLACSHVEMLRFRAWRTSCRRQCSRCLWTLNPSVDPVFDCSSIRTCTRT
jgi:hypothetical protein